MITPQFYYEWGNEPAGYVSTGCYIDEVFLSCSQMLKTNAINIGLRFHNPFS